MKGTYNLQASNTYTHTVYTLTFCKYLSQQWETQLQHKKYEVTLFKESLRNWWQLKRMFFLVYMDTAATLESYTRSHLVEILSDKSFSYQFVGNFSLISESKISRSLPCHYQCSSASYLPYPGTHALRQELKHGLSKPWMSTQTFLSVTPQAHYQMQLIFIPNTCMEKIANSGKLNILQVQ